MLQNFKFSLEEEDDEQDNESNQQHFTFLNLLYFTLKYILPTNAKIERSFSSIKIEFDKINLKIIQLANWFTFIYTYNSEQNYKFNLNSKQIFKPQITNYFIKPHNLSDLNKYYKDNQLLKIQNIIQGRIFRFQKNKGLIKLLKSKYCSRQLFKFLRIQDIQKFEYICYDLYKQFNQNEYWFNLYIDIYGYTGFRLEQFNWKQKLLQKDKQIQQQKK